jgi:A/G-specific adenine glycosylase
VLFETPHPIATEEMQASASVAPALLAWWDRHGRKDLPWQQHPTPYRVWVSEVMLQQTQVATVTRYYDAFLAAFPTVTVLADAPLDAVLHRWSGLGYYARARNLKRAAEVMRDAHGGEVPTTLHALTALPGIGRSTAGAILALSRNQRHPILDGNVKRVLARVFRLEGDPSDAAVLREFWRLAEACTPETRVGHYTQAIMDLGASLCARRKPACGLCPLNHLCRAYREGVADLLPARRRVRARPQRATIVLLCVRPDGAVLLERRPPEGIWGGLWGLPETTTLEQVPAWCQQALGLLPRASTVRPVLRHGFTHFDLDMTPVELVVDAPPLRALESHRWLWYDRAAPAEVGLAAPVTKLLSSL